MNPNLQKYVDALRSGHYIQVKRNLKNTSVTGGEDRCFCAVGVACDVYSKENPELAWWHMYKFIIVEQLEDSSIRTAEYMQSAPTEVLEWFGLNEKEQDALIHLNDTLGYSFGSIADWISTDVYDRDYPPSIDHLHPNYDNAELN